MRVRDLEYLRQLWARLEDADERVQLMRPADRFEGESLSHLRDSLRSAIRKARYLVQSHE